jgi:predicted small secreted protein
MKSLLLRLLLGAALLGVVSACNTIAGMGEDLSAAGRGITRGAETTKQKM